MVAVVVNAIDDQLKGSAQLRVMLSSKHIRPLAALLEAAESTGRLVLLVSDHGNISSQRFIGAAARLPAKEAQGAEKQVRRAWQFAYQRDPTPDELKLATKLVTDHGLKALCRVLFNSNEFVTVE